jgi:hypothetical protein
MISLDKNNPMTISGSSTVQITGSVFGNGGITVNGNGNTNQTCAGGWFAANTISPGLNTDVNGNPAFSPIGCSGSDDSTPDTNANFPPINDPYAGSVAPPVGGTFSNCTECTSNGWWFNLDNNTWNQGGSPSGDAELFPGIYTSLAASNGGYFYFNPGVYDFTSGIDIEHGNMCIYGSPSCANASVSSSISTNCANTPFTIPSTTANQWYYACSPYGFWDSASSINGVARPATLPTTPPYFYDPSGTNTQVPLNGVTFYLPPGSGGFNEHGNGGTNGGVYLAAPDPCPGTGTYTSGSAPAVTFPGGSTSGVYSFGSSYTGNSTTANFLLPHGVTQSSASTIAGVYPDDDFSEAGECSSAYETLEVWPGELTIPHHLHFLFYITDTSATTLNGTSGQNLTGIFYDPSGSLTLNGNHNPTNGAPWINGQLVAYDLTFGGNSTDGVSYRPCGPSNSACGSGYGTQLIE